MERFIRIFAVLLVLVLLLSFTSTSYAQGFKNLKAYYRGIKIFRNNNMVKIDIEPFIINGTTFVPLRALAELLDKEVDWDGKNYRIHIKDKGGNFGELYKIIQEQKETIEKQEARIKELEERLAKYEQSSLKDLEKRLNKEYGQYKDIKFDIKLEETRTEIKVKIYTDLKENKNNLKDLRAKGFNEYLKNIINEVRKEIRNKAIVGALIDSNKDNEILTFILNIGNSVDISFAVDRIEELELLLEWKYADNNGINELRLEKDDDEIEIILYVDRSKWNDLRESKQEELLEEIYKEIRKHFDGEIEGEIRNYSNNKKIYEFRYNKKGNVSIE